MESYVSFSDDNILDSATSPEGSLEDATRVAIPWGALPTSTGTPTEEEAAEEPVPPEVVTKEAAPAGKPLKGSTLPPVAVDHPTGGLTTPQAQHEEQKKMEAPHGGYPHLDKNVTPSPAGYHCGTNCPGPKWIKGETLQLECRGRRAQH